MNFMHRWRQFNRFIVLMNMAIVKKPFLTPAFWAGVMMLYAVMEIAGKSIILVCHAV